METARENRVKLYSTERTVSCFTASNHKSTIMARQLAVEKLAQYSQYKHHGKGKKPQRRHFWRKSGRERTKINPTLDYIHWRELREETGCKTDSKLTFVFADAESFGLSTNAAVQLAMIGLKERFVFMTVV